MKVRSELLVTCAALALCAVTPVRAADLVTKAPVVAPIAWWYEGYAEIGGRFDINDPGQRTLGRFYKYEDLRPGVFGNFYYGAHRTGPDPLDLAFWGTNIGWDDQAFGVDVSRPGTYYLTFGWDETPHVYSKDAKTPFRGIGSNNLTVSCFPTTGGLCVVGGAPNAGTNSFVTGNSTTFDLGFRRDTASASARWTPTDNWDIGAAYSHMHREGTQQLSAVTFYDGAAGRASTQLPKPLDDTTQNAKLKAEYAGSSPWGKPFNVALAYGLSMYNNSFDSLTFQNPWAPANTAAQPLFNRYSLAPDNQAHSVNLTGGAGLPWNSRYMGTFQYTWMNQDQAFLPSTSNPAVAAAVTPITSVGDARTILSNNVINTKITNNLSSTLRYRYYDYHTDQAPVGFTGLFANPDTNITPEGTIFTRPVNFSKQNAGAQLDWRPWQWLNTGAAYEFEHQAKLVQGVDVVTLQNSGSGFFNVVTNENAVKGFADAKLWSWSTLRTSLRYGERRLGSDYVNPLNNNNAFRMVDFQDRDTTEAKVQWALDVLPNVTITPTGGYRLDDYASNAVGTFGIRKAETWNVGGDISWVVSPMATLYASYIHDNGTRDVYNGNANVFAGTAVNLDLLTRDQDDVFIFGAKVTAIPDLLFLTMNYTYAQSTSQWTSNCGPTGRCILNPMPTFPDTHNRNHRIDAQAKYMLDKSLLRNAGLLATTQPYLKFRVIYEHNENDSWQNVEQQLGWSTGTTNAATQRAIFLGMPDPNYNVVVGMVSLGVKW